MRMFTAATAREFRQVLARLTATGWRAVPGTAAVWVRDGREYVGCVVVFACEP